MQTVVGKGRRRRRRAAAGCALRVAGCGLRAAGCGLRAAHCAFSLRIFSARIALASRSVNSSTLHAPPIRYGPDADGIGR
ncbi:hypothetical protein D2V84_16370 [Burkholderia pseudomallei]|nr:hypothetical protein D2V84_16370 [Burkholderia pseudomallei]RIV78489.1 hypothetical protein D2W72_00655 [Burkholderia pseudomallei]